jgi:hypothetical protein
LVREYTALEFVAGRRTVAVVRCCCCLEAAGVFPAFAVETLVLAAVLAGAFAFELAVALVAGALPFVAAGGAAAKTNPINVDNKRIS